MRLHDIADARIELAEGSRAARGIHRVRPKECPSPPLLSPSSRPAVAFWSLLRAPEPAARPVVRSTLTASRRRVSRTRFTRFLAGHFPGWAIVAYVAGDRGLTPPLPSKDRVARSAADRRQRGRCDTVLLARRGVDRFLPRTERSSAPAVSGGAPLRVPVTVADSRRGWTGAETSSCSGLAGLLRVPAGGW